MDETLKILNMKCGGCVNTVTKEISSIEGVSGVEVSLEKHTLSFSYDSSEQLDTVKEVLKKIGHPEDNTNDLLNKAKSLLNN